ncbi:MAG TPA: isoleucine--tRNA ligase [Pirellulaceae bacterium]|jgi:isoleucyl-tRNA synthetase
MFQPVSASANLPRQEEEILQFWKERGIFDQSIEQRRQKNVGRFVFYEGPPTANGMPHPGHCLTRAIKDLFPRYKTMRGYLCERKAGWDTHGLPVEVEVCKELGIHSKEEIENFGIEPFIHRCQESVWRYMKEWERLTERLGFWIHLEDAYVTYHQSYVESVWWSLKNLFDRNLLYQGHKIVWWWAQGGTALSSGEVGQGYREVADPSVYVLFPIVLDDRAKQLGINEPTSLLIWTTTPWTLPSNQFAAVRVDIEYALTVEPESGERILMAAALVEALSAKSKTNLETIKTFRGEELVGLRYLPPFDYFHRTDDHEEVLEEYTDSGLDTLLESESGSNGREPEFRVVRQHPSWRIVAADFVTIETGTGIVHIAPAFGEEDYKLLEKEQLFRWPEDEGPKLLCPVGPDGVFEDIVHGFAGKWVKDCDKEIIRHLKDPNANWQKRNLLFHQEQYIHDYPFCWRAEQDPLIQYPRESWFIKTTAFKDEMLANNEQINWLPEHIKHGRFGNFLESNVDWALSRERYWGTPLPIWVCEQTGKMEAVASYEELLKKPGVTGQEVWDAAKKAKPSLPDDLCVHKPYIDAVTYDSPFAKGACMNRVTEVIDCWYDSGAMPFAQWGYPHSGQEKFKEQFPADFISEALDQTRGWFYSQLAISTMLFGPGVQSSKFKVQSQENELTLNLEPGTLNCAYPHPFRTCIVLGLMLGEDGQKMSKSKRNYREPSEIFDKHGADALRWFFFAQQPPWTTIRYAERAIKDTIPEFILRLWNCFSFFVNYANSNDRFEPEKLFNGDPQGSMLAQRNAVASGSPLNEPMQLTAADLAKGKGFRPANERGELDRWILSELNRTAAAVVERMDTYDNYEAAKKLHAFVDGLSNWYVRRSRDRFWAAMDSAHQQDKLDAYWTLYEALLTTAKLIAPFTPFLAEALWQNLTGVFGDRAVRSVHLCEYPTGDRSAVDEKLSEQMKLLREIASLGLSARMANKLKVRQPLSKVEVILSDATHQKWLEEHDELLRDELNVKKIDYTKDAEKYITYQVQPNFKRLGPRIGKLLPGCKTVLGKADGGKLLAELTASGKVTLDIDGETIELDNEDIQVRLQAKPGWAAAQGTDVVVVLATELTPDLVAEGLSRDFVRLVQDRRKDLGLEFTDRIDIGVVGASEVFNKAVVQFADYICGETLAKTFSSDSISGVEPVEVEVGDEKISLFVKKQ